MRPESLAMLRVLLEHHRFNVFREDGTVPPRNDCLLSYGNMCDQAGVPHLTRSPGIFLAEVAAWCAQRGLPPINALAINADTGMPGDNYEGAPGCHMLTWPAECDAAIACRRYLEII